ncbi:MAG: response regulator [Candidatus Riflebacteria bacterium]|nr:response regulator [Candidatus Riflebacteria bacterium]
MHKLLIVEDEPQLRSLFINAFKRLNVSAVAVENGIEGLAAFESFNPDIVLTDIRMPKMSGLELLREIRIRSTRTIVVVMTALDSPELPLEALRMGASDFIRKPVILSELFQTLKKYLNFLENNTQQTKTLGKYIYREAIIEFPTRIDLVPRMVSKLIRGISIPENILLGVHLGLAELITNAIEHGNMGISYDEKCSALKNDPMNGLEELYKSRLQLSETKRKKILVHFKMRKNVLQWKISDEGIGFDWESLPDPTSPENLLGLSGRGILLSRMQFDRLEYIGSGNTVKITKRISVV